MSRLRAPDEIIACIGMKVYSKATAKTYVVMFILWDSKAGPGDPQIQYVQLLNLATQKHIKVYYPSMVQMVNDGRLVLGYFEAERTDIIT